MEACHPEVRVLPLAIPDHFIEHGTVDRQRMKIGLNVQGILDAVEPVSYTHLLPEDILTLGIDGVNQIWRDAKLRAVGRARANTLIEAAEHSVGSKEGALSLIHI